MTRSSYAFERQLIDRDLSLLAFKMNLTMALIHKTLAISDLHP